MISNKKGLDFKALIEDFEIFGDLGEAVCVFGLVGRFLSKNLSVEFIEKGQEIGVEVFIPDVELVFVLSSGAIEA